MMPEQDGSDSGEPESADNPDGKKPLSFADCNREFAQKIHAAGIIYGLYGALDGLSLSYSTVKYIFDILNTNSGYSSTDSMHEWMATSTGAAIATSETVALISFSLLANVLKDDDKMAFKRYVSITWPFVRDAIKGMKNAFKGLRSTIQVVGVFAGQDWRYMIVPTSLVFGVFAVLNRLWNRNMVNTRKEMMSVNADLLQAIQLSADLLCAIKLCEWDGSYKEEGQCEFVVSSIKPSEMTLAAKQAFVLYDGQLFYVEVNKTDSNNKGVNKCINLHFSSKDLQALQMITRGQKSGALSVERLKNIKSLTHEVARSAMNQQLNFLSSIKWKAFLSQTYSGFIDSLYLYMGVLGVVSLAPQAFLILTITSLLFSAVTIATRIYEEYDYQRKLEISQSKIKLVICGEELVALFYQLQESLLSKPLSLEQDKAQKKEFEETLTKKLEEFDAQRFRLRQMLVLSNAEAFLTGLKYGLAAYSAIASVVFAAATISVVLLVPLSATFVFASVLAGVGVLVGFSSFYVLSNYWHTAAQKNRLMHASLDSIDQEGTLGSLLKKLKENQIVANELVPDKLKTAILGSMKVDCSPQFFFQEWFEVVRSFFSGLAKGQKSIDYTCNSLQEADENGHYQDTPIMFLLSLVSATLYSVLLALRAYARGFGRKEMDDDFVKKEPDAAVSRPSFFRAEEEASSLLKKSNSRLTSSASAPKLCYDREKPASPFFFRPGPKESETLVLKRSNTAPSLHISR